MGIDQRSDADAPGFIFVAPKGGDPQGPEIVDDFGRPVWFHPVSGQATDFRIQTYRGQPVLTWWQGSGFGGVSSGVDYVLDSSYQLVATVHGADGLQADGHEFLLTAAGTALIIAKRVVPYDLSSLGGAKNGAIVDDVVQEIDVATGQLLFSWHSIDNVPPSASYAPIPPVGEPYDYFHMNAVNLDTDGNLLISSRHTWTVYKVDRHTGAIIWRLGGKQSDFTLGPGARFAWQHDAVAVAPDEIMLFDNGSNETDIVEPESRVLWLRLDLGSMSALVVKEIPEPSGLSATSQGNAQALPNGDTFVGWGALGRVSEFDASGRLLLQAHFQDYDTYRAYRFPWSATPTTIPTVRAARARHGTSVDAVWNGATDVARWRIVGGSRLPLRPLATIAWSGLDTAFMLRGTPRRIQAVALAANGSVVGRSRVISVAKS